MKISDKILRIKKRFARVTAGKFLYKIKSDIHKKSKKIVVYFLVSSKNRGVFIMRFVFSSAENLSVNQWTDYFKKGRRKNPSILHVMREVIFPDINHKYKDIWELINVVGWHFPRD